MGLLDYDFSKALNSDQGRLGLGLLAAAAPSNQGFGQRLQSALGYVQGQQDRDMQKQMQQFQMQDLIAQAAARKRDAERQAKAEQTQQKVSEYAKQFMPQVGPQMEGEPVDLMQPQQPQGFNMQGFLQGLPGVMDDPLQALEYAKKFAPEKEDAYTLGEGQQRFRGNMLIAQGPEKKPNMSTDLLVPGPDGKLIPNAALIAVKEGLAKSGSSRNSTTVINKGADAFDVETAKLDAKELETLREGAKTAQSVLGTVASLRAAEKQGAYSGGGADARLAAANLIEGWTGIAPKGLVGSQIYNAEANKLILDRVKTLGANPSNADREFLQKTVPQLATNAQARTAMADWMERQAQRSIKTYQDANAYARQNRGLGGFNSAPAQMDATPSNTTPQMPQGFRVVR